MRRRWKLYLSALSFVLLAVLALTPNSRVKADDDNHVTFTTIDFPGAASSVGRDVTAASDAYVGEYNDTAGHHGFLLKSDSFTAIDFPGVSSTDAHGINARGEIVGVYRTANGEPHGYLLNNDGFTSFDFPDATGTSAMGINDRGDIVGGWCDGTITPCPVGGEGHRGFLLSGGQFTTIDFPGASLTEAWKIDSRGRVVGFYVDPGGSLHGFLWSAGQFDSIDFLGATGTAAFGINNRGEIVGSYCLTVPCGTSLVKQHGFISRRGEFTSFDFPGAEGTRAFAINDRGDIAGAFVDLAGKNHAFLISKEGEDDEN